MIRDLNGEQGRPYTLHVANRVWGDREVDWRETWLDVQREVYGAPMGRRDIAGDPEGARRAVNDWVARETRDHIRGMMPPGTVTRRTRLVLANAIYFRAPWHTPFSSAKTVPEPWTSLDGAVDDRPMMHREDVGGRHHAADGYTLASLPYEGGDVAMWVLLPDAPDGLPQIEAALTTEGLNAAFDAAEATSLTVTLPRFGIEATLDLVPTLGEMGMPEAFSEAADFSGMADEPLYIDTARHRALVRVEEQGTEATAATTVLWDPLSPAGEVHG